MRDVGLRQHRPARQSIEPIARVRPSAGLALGWVAYGLFYAVVAGCLIGPVLLASHLLAVQLGQKHTGRAPAGLRGKALRAQRQRRR